MAKPTKGKSKTKKIVTRGSSRKTAALHFGLHDVMAQADPEYAMKRKDWVDFLYFQDRHLEPRTKELVIIGILAALKSPPPYIKAHIEQAVKAGASKEEVIAVVQFAGHWGGTATQHNALEAWRLQFAAEKPEIYRALKP